MRRIEAVRWRAALAVLLLHGLLWWALRPSPPRLPPAPPAPPPPVAWMRLLPAPALQTAPPAATGAPQAPSVASPRSPPRVSAPTAPLATNPVEPRAITLPAPVEAAAASTAPLMLALPPAPAGSAPGWREQMLRDPRANSRAARGATETLQSLAGDGRRREETLAGEGRRRVRIDGACFEVHQARMAQLDPHLQSSNPLPAQVRACD